MVQRSLGEAAGPQKIDAFCDTSSECSSSVLERRVVFSEQANEVFSEEAPLTPDEKEAAFYTASDFERFRDENTREMGLYLRRTSTFWDHPEICVRGIFDRNTKRLRRQMMKEHSKAVLLCQSLLKEQGRLYDVVALAELSIESSFGRVEEAIAMADVDALCGYRQSPLEAIKQDRSLSRARKLALRRSESQMVTVDRCQTTITAVA